MALNSRNYDKLLVLMIVAQKPDSKWHDMVTPRWMSRAYFLDVVSDLFFEGKVEKIKHEATFDFPEWYGYRLIEK